MERRLFLLCALVLGAVPSLTVAQTLTKCSVGQAVVDREGKSGLIVSADSNLCQVKYPDGQVYGWIYWNLRPDVAAGAPAQSGKPLDPAPTAPVPLPTILRPGPSTHTLVYRAGPLGHVVLTAAVNGAPVRFLVDTGASTVALSAADARAVGINPGALVFDRTTTTANGLVRVAPIILREIRIEQLSVENVPAVVDANLSGSLLGMSFLSRLKSFEMREGALTFSW
jgi:aspartyl protease family protein